MSRYRAFLLSTLAALVVMSSPSCSQRAKYRLLTFIFQGVPEPGAAAAAAAATALATVDPDAAPRAPERAALVKERFNWHPPYRNNRCNFCHDVYQGKLVMSPEDGLCVSCHTDPPGDRKFVHGPVAANACLMCHHHHMSARPRLLLDEVNTLCLSCHDLDDILEGEQHNADLRTDSVPTCIQCHDPHGGGNKLFLKQSAQ